ncbi:hypothetical protein [Bradyrhizobium canariense]|uniref:FlaG protein n=1 Tax=Bradyrhizobium canariense TaxID=255045 RepID=A0A1H1MFS8_9BRAD|nr:hypothetical protein [Bradyrhizobium canariense]SDR85556.1 hypothetical protein SAMN05444158_0209 [Bradyrhizobium canariense]
MSTDFSIKSVGAPAAIAVGQPVSDATSNAVATQLPANQAVTAADPSAGARNDPQPASDSVSHQAFFDQAAASIVFQVVNSNNDQVVEQFPDDATLRRRAYFHALDLAKDQPARPLATDLKA